ncbi:MAG: PD-(D/E)XK nuclease family protein [Proteobacteria bacterium]|nr:PD-(D/E)XK nuclease family protein [Pseudomonadota bacterium]
MNPSSGSNSLLFENWLNQVHPISLRSERLAIARTFTKTLLPAEQWLPTIELLRRSLVLNREQVTYCFSQLPNTQKNRALRECFLFYLNSPLSEDLMRQVWSFIELLKSNKSEKPHLSPVDFIATEPSSYLFQELVKTVISQSPQTRSHSLFDLGPPFSATKPQVTLGSTVATLETLCNQVADLAKINQTEKLLISFGGSFQSRAFLRSRLASHGLLAVDWLPLTPVTNSFWSKMLCQIRKNDLFEAEKKLELNSLLLANPPFEGEIYDDYKERMTSRKMLSSEILDTLSGLATETVPDFTLSSHRVLITPFCALPQFEKTTEFCFVDQSLLEPTPSTTLFSETELDTLFFAGFQLPRWSETLHGRLNVLKQKASFLNERVFCSLPPEHLEGFKITSPKTPPRAFPSPTDSHRASLPVQALSATQLETYSECPSKYLFRRFKLHQVPMPMGEFALHLGQSVHLTLETLFAPPTQPTLDADLLRNTFIDSLRKTLPQLSNQENLSIFFLKAFDKMIPRILEMEVSLNTIFGNRSTLAVEKEFKIDVDGIPLVGKIDRIDLLSNNSLLVLDYKTGNVDFTPDHLAKGFNFQALLYWLGAEETLGMSPAAMLFYDLKKGEIKRGLAKEETISTEAKKSLTRGHAMSSEKLEALIQSGKEVMQNHAINIRAGIFAPNPSSEACRFCEAVGFCREGAGYA